MRRNSEDDIDGDDDDNDDKVGQTRTPLFSRMWHRSIQ
jgi:hypothetical protein